MTNLKQSFLRMKKAPKVGEEHGPYIHITMNRKIIEHEGKTLYEFSVKLSNQ